jgi:hypothetical protein
MLPQGAARLLAGRDTIFLLMAVSPGPRPSNLLAVRRLIVAMALAVITACGSSSAAVVGAADVAVKSSDVPKGVQQCSGSGSIDSFLNAVKTKDPNTYQSTKTEWDKAKSNGATEAQVVFYADSKAHCDAITNSQNSELASATYPIVINFVIKFKDQASAAQGYTSESIFGFSESTISTSAGAGVVKGADTGLGKNSISLTLAIGNQSFYVAVWQNKAFMVILAVINVDTAQAKKIASNENGRIK